jgi:ABC-2 type transport system permease protein/sodium transport system permease protein
MPELTLDGPLCIAPLVNIVLLARDLFDQTARAQVAIVVVVSTILYAVGAIALAARFFGAEAVLYTAQSGWAHLRHRPLDVQPVPSATSAMFCLALLFPLHFLVVNSLARIERLDYGDRLALASAATALLFALLPAAAAWRGRVPLAAAFQARLPHRLAVPGAIFLGAALWPFAHEVMLWQFHSNWQDLLAERQAEVQAMLERLRELPLVYVVACLAVVPAVCEELFFRGYLLGALVYRNKPFTAVMASSLLFGAFHLVAAGDITFERLLPSTLLGLVLGFVCLKTRSVVPGMVLHAVHNGLIVSAAHRLPQWEEFLRRTGWDNLDTAHVPAEWLIGAAIVAAAGAALVFVPRTPRTTPLAARADGC